MVTLELSVEEAKILREQLAHRITQLDRDLVRTDQHRLQHALAQDVAHLGDIEQRLAALLGDCGADG
jgi:hypothetical protein